MNRFSHPGSLEVLRHLNTNQSSQNLELLIQLMFAAAACFKDSTLNLPGEPCGPGGPGGPGGPAKKVSDRKTRVKRSCMLYNL